MEGPQRRHILLSFFLSFALCLFAGSVFAAKKPPVKRPVCKKGYAKCVLACNQRTVALHKKCKQVSFTARGKCRRSFRKHIMQCIPGCYQDYCVKKKKKSKKKKK